MPRDFTELRNNLGLQEGQIKEEYQRGFRILASVIDPSFDFSTGFRSDENLVGILSKAVQPTKTLSGEALRIRGNKIIDLQVSVVSDPGISYEDYQKIVLEKKNQYRKSWDDLCAILSPWIDAKIIELSKKQHDLKKTSEQFVIHTETLSQDNLRIIAPREFIGSLEYQQILSEIRLVWSVLRTKDVKSTIVTIFFHPQPDDVFLRSHCFMNKSPDMLLAYGKYDVLGTARHESVHAIFGIESGQPLSYGYVEGCATRLGRSFDKKNDSASDPRLTPGAEYLKRIISGGGRFDAHSHTQLLDQFHFDGNVIFQYDNGQDATRELSYLYGYAFMDAILKSTTFKKSMERNTKAGKNPYRLLFQLNKALTLNELQKRGLIFYKDGIPNIHERRVFQVVLPEFGFDYGEIMRMTNFALEQIMQGDSP